MNRFSRRYEFERELKKLSKKFPSLEDDLKNLERVIASEPLGIGKNFIVIHDGEDIIIVKARLACRSLRGDRAMRIIYAYHESSISFMYIELYHKGSKESEDSQRYNEYIEECKRNKSI